VGVGVGGCGGGGGWVGVCGGSEVSFRGGGRGGGKGRRGKARERMSVLEEKLELLTDSTKNVTIPKSTKSRK